jgi:hypothetical protein
MALAKLSSRLTAILFCYIFSISAAAQNTQPFQEFGAQLIEWSTTQKSLSGNSRLIIFQPPNVVSPSLSSVSAEESEGQVRILADRLPLPKQIFADSGLEVGTVFQAIINNRQPEDFKLTKVQLRDLAIAERILLKRACWFKFCSSRKIAAREPSKKYQAYNTSARRYAKIATTIENETDEVRIADLHALLAKARKDWIEKGHKIEVEKALLLFEEIQKSNPENFWSETYQNFRIHSRLIKGSRVPTTLFYPSPLNWSDNVGWEDFRRGQFSGQLKFITIRREWLNERVLFEKSVRWNNGTFLMDGVIVSDGKGFQTNLSGVELMPFLPTAIILARNISSSSELLIKDPMIVGTVCLIVPPLPVRQK